MATLLRMPEIAANATEAVLQEWAVEEGGAYDEAQALAAVETDKAVVDIEAEQPGVLLKTLVSAGVRVPVGAPIAVLGGPDETRVDVDRVLVELGVDGGQQRMGETSAPEATPAPDSPVAADAGDAATANGDAAASDDGRRRIFASPLARRLAREAGLELGEIPGTGPRGRVLRRDVEAAETAGRDVAATPTDRARERGPTDAGSQPEAEATPHSPMRRAIARRLTESKQQVPHFYVRGTARVDALLALRREVNEGTSAGVSLNDLVVKAVATAHRLVPRMNVTWSDDALHHHTSVDVALAVATEDGLLTPVLREVDRMTLSDVGAATRDIAERARAGALRQHELDGGCLTVSNLGMYGVEEFTAIINPPQSAILAVGAVRRSVVAADSGPEVATVMTVTLSVDHRAIDGVHAGEWLRVLVDLLEHPVRILV